MKKLFLILSISVLFIFTTSYGQNEVVKTKLIYQMIPGVTWPMSMYKGDFVIGVFGNAVMEMNMKKLGETIRTAQGQHVVVKPFGSLSELPQCHVLYVSTGNSSLLGQVLKALGNANTLVITDSPGLCKKGADFNFVMDGSNQKIEVNKANIQKRGLTVLGYPSSICIPVN